MGPTFFKCFLFAPSFFATLHAKNYQKNRPVCHGVIRKITPAQFFETWCREKRPARKSISEKYLFCVDWIFGGYSIIKSGLPQSIKVRFSDPRGMQG